MNVKRTTILSFSAMILSLSLFVSVWVGFSAELPQTCTFPFAVASESDLNAAIACYNAETTVGNYAINFTANISLTTATTVIDSTSPSVALTINGNDNTLDGQNAQRGLTIAASTNVTVNALTIINGRAPADVDNGARGGAIWHELGSLTINDSTFINNHATDSFSRGGAIYHNQGTLEINDSIFRDNSANQGGAILNFIGDATIHNSTFTGNTANSGGAIGYFGGSFSGSLLVSLVTFSQNEANEGGGLYNNSGVATIEASLFADNVANNSGGAISNNGGDTTLTTSNVRDNHALSNGGGIFNDGTLLITHSTLVGNSADSDGGAIFNTGGIADLTLVNSTVSGNSVRLGEGGGIKMTSDATTMLIYTTLSNNDAAVVADGGTFISRNTIIANSNGANCLLTGEVGIEVVGTNMSDDGSCTIFSHPDTDPQLLPLDTNDNSTLVGSTVGGSTPETPQTHSLFYVSPAIDAGDAGVCSAEPVFNVDQRFVARPIGARCDIGAHEGTACPTEFIASDELTLDTAIVCFNHPSVAETVTVSVTNNIDMPFFPSPINNGNVGAHLVIEGNGFVISGLGTHRGFEISLNTTVTINALSIYDMNANDATGGAISNRGNLTLNNSTVSSSRARLGGGIVNVGSGSLTLNNSTIANNTATDSNGGGGIYNTGTLRLRNTIIGDSSNGDCINNGGVVATAVNNLIEGTGSNACHISGGGNIIGQDARLQPFQYYGGPAATHGLLQTSPAIEAGDSATCANAPINNVDQRGFPRPYNGTCDIGAVEASSCDIPQPWSAGTLDELNERILCFNYVVHLGVHTIDLTADIWADVFAELPGEAFVRTVSNHTPNVTLQINGNGFALDGADLFRVMSIDVQTNVILENITIRNGYVLDDIGAGILNGGNLTLNHSTVRGNDTDEFDPPQTSFGGGILNLSTANLTLNNSTVYHNSALGGGGGIYNAGIATLNNSTVSNNGDAGLLDTISSVTTLNNTTMSGNFLNIRGTLHARNSIIANNPTEDCVNEGGTIATMINTLIESGHCGPTFTGDPRIDPLADNGGTTLTHALQLDSPAIDVGDLQTCVVAPINGLDQRGVTRFIDGDGDGTVHCDIGAYEAPDVCVHAFPIDISTEAALRDAINCFNTILVNADYVVNLTSDIVLQFALPTIDNVKNGVSLTINGNGFALDGNDSVRVLAISAETNTTLNALVIRNGDAIEGGGIFNEGNVTLNASLVRDNDASSFGGGIRNEGTMTVNNSTLSGNRSDVNGGGISNDGVLAVNNSTVSAGTAGNGAGIHNTGTLELRNTILGNNGNNRDCTNSGTIAVSVNNLIEGTGSQACNISGNGNIIGQDPALGALQDNGGATHTYALLTGSPAINAGDNASCLATDQRGEARDDGACDIGAFEAASVPTAVMVSSAEISPTLPFTLLLLALLLTLTTCAVKLESCTMRPAMWWGKLIQTMRN